MYAVHIMPKGNNDYEDTAEVSCVGISVPDFLTVTNSPITTSGTINISLNHNPLPLSSGGTGMTAVGSIGQVLSVISTEPEQIGWTSIEGTGTVTSISMSTPDFMSVTPSTIISAGTFDLGVSTIPITHGGTGLSTVGLPGQILAVSPDSTLEYTDVTGVTSVSLTTNTPFITTSPESITSYGALSVDCSTIPISHGGTGLATVGSPGQVLSVTENSTLSYTTPDVGVTLISMTTPNFLTVTPSTITSSGVFDITLSSESLPISSGGTGLSTIGLPGQILSVSSNSMLEYKNEETGVTSVSLSTSTPFLTTSQSSITSSGTLTVDCTTIPISSGGTGLTVPGSDNQILTSKGTALYWSDPPNLDKYITAINIVAPFTCSGGPTPTIAISDYTGSGKIVFDNSPILVSPILGDATVSSLTLNGSQSGSIRISAFSGNYNFTLPTTAGQLNQILTSQGPFNPTVWSSTIGTGSIVRAQNATLSGQTTFVNGTLLCQSKLVQSQGLLTITTDLTLTIDQFFSFLITHSAELLTVTIPTAQEFQDTINDFTIGNRVSTIIYNTSPKLVINTPEGITLIDGRISASQAVQELTFVLTNSAQGLLLVK